MKNTRSWINSVGSALLAFGFGGLAQAQIAVPPVPPAPAKPPFADPQDAIVARHAAFKAQGDIFGAMKKAIDAGEDPKPFADDAKWLVAWAKQIPEMFPKGSDTGHDTKALPAIWTDKDTFDKDNAAYEAAVTKLAVLIEAGDKEGFAKQFRDTGATCGACHRAFRAKLQ